MNTKAMAGIIFSKVLKSVDPLFIVREYAEKIRSYYERKEFNSLIVIGFGKASYQMAKAVEEVFDAHIKEGAVVTKYGHAINQHSAVSDQPLAELKKIKVFEAAHPIPDAKGIAATEHIINLVENRDEKTLVLCLVSGGGSALFVSPCEGITLQEKQEITDLLLRAGADIT